MVSSNYRPGSPAHWQQESAIADLAVLGQPGTISAAPLTFAVISFRSWSTAVPMIPS